jgi:hypothetical protein
MSYKCKRSGCNKTASYRSGLKCYRCDTQQAAAQGVTPIYSAPPTYSESADIGSGEFRSGGGGDFGGGGASGSWSSDSSSSDSGGGGSSGSD